MFEVSIIIPCRDEQENAKIITKNIQENCKYKNFEIIFINDFSEDQTEQVLNEISSEFKNISYFNNKKRIRWCYKTWVKKMYRQLYNNYDGR